MNKYTLILFTLFLCFSLANITPYANASDQSAQRVQAAYEDQARALAGKIKTGFKETSYLPGVVECAGDWLKKYAEVLSEAESVTEMYLLTGKDTQPQLDLNNKDDVIKLLKTKFHDRVSKKAGTGVAYIFNAAVGKCVEKPLDMYVGMRISQAVEWAFTH